MGQYKTIYSQMSITPVPDGLVYLTGYLDMNNEIKFWDTPILAFELVKVDCWHCQFDHISFNPQSEEWTLETDTEVGGIIIHDGCFTGTCSERKCLSSCNSISEIIRNSDIDDAKQYITEQLKGIKRNESVQS